MSVVVVATQVGAEVSLEVVETVEVRDRRDACVSVTCARGCRRSSEWEEPPEQVRE